MTKYNKKAALKIIVKAAKEYDEKLNDKHFLIVYQKAKSVGTVCVGFRFGKTIDFQQQNYSECTYISKG